jgi:DNA-directed RNA polymerase subunit N (RpoN/RPB10)
MFQTAIRCNCGREIQTSALRFWIAKTQEKKSEKEALDLCGLPLYSPFAQKRPANSPKPALELGSTACCRAIILAAAPVIQQHISFDAALVTAETTDPPALTIPTTTTIALTSGAKIKNEDNKMHDTG